jgi:hypothetical protein
MAQNRTCNLSVTGRPSSPLRHVFKVPPDMVGYMRSWMMPWMQRQMCSADLQRRCEYQQPVRRQQQHALLNYPKRVLRGFLFSCMCLQVGHIEDVVVDEAARGHKLGQRWAAQT